MMRILATALVFGWLVSTATMTLCAQTIPGGNPFVSTFERSQLEAIRDGQSVDAFHLFLCAAPQMDAVQSDQLHAQLKTQVSTLLPAHTTPARVDALFRGLRSKMLRTYTPVASLHDIFATGTFNCVSATALMALVYADLGIDIELCEQPRHVFLYATDAGHRMRIETTAADFGAIREKANPKIISGKASKSPTATHTIDLVQLAGLQYYNAGLQALDQSQPGLALDNFLKAQALYPGARITEMLQDAANQCYTQGHAALLDHDWDHALALLERAARFYPPTDLDRALSAAILHRAENQSQLPAMMEVLQAYATWRPSLLQQEAYAATMMDLHLALAIQLFQDPQATDLATQHIAAFENLYAQTATKPTPQLAATAYAAAFRFL